MKRRNFIQQGMGAAGAMLMPVSLMAAETNRKYNTGKPFKLNYAFHDGMFKNSAGKDFSDQIRYGYDQGFRAIEDNGMMRPDT